MPAEFAVQQDLAFILNANLPLELLIFHSVCGDPMNGQTFAKPYEEATAMVMVEIQQKPIIFTKISYNSIELLDSMDFRSHCIINLDKKEFRDIRFLRLFNPRRRQQLLAFPAMSSWPQCALSSANSMILRASSRAGQLPPVSGS